MGPLMQCVYVSTARRLMDAPDLESILVASRRRNTADAVTGVLVYVDGTFFQVLEGTKGAIDRVLERIRRDARHYDITVLLSQEVAARSFPDWSMGYRRLSREQVRAEGWFDSFPENPQPWSVTLAQPSAGVVLARKFLAVNR